MFNTITLAQAMTRHPHSIRAGESLRTAEKMLEKLGVHHLPVRDGGKLVGVITDSDIAFAARLRGGNIDHVPVEDACVDEPFTVDVDTAFNVALGIMVDKNVDSLLITEVDEDANDSPTGGSEPKLCGILTLRDVARVLHQRLSAGE